jgi:AcrR family transcriptional regulator
MTLDTSLSPDLDPRRTAILGAAFESFARYGYRRTTMEDIARATGLSRAALYLHFQNKQDILRSLTQYYFDATEARMRLALDPANKPKHALAAAFEAKFGPEMQVLIESPHGAELLDIKHSESADLIAAGEARLAGLLADWLRRETASGRIAPGPLGADPDLLAQTMVAALAGAKMAANPRAAIQLLAQTFARALKP